MYETKFLTHKNQLLKVLKLTAIPFFLPRVFLFFFLVKKSLGFSLISQ